ncbi:DUF493 family protein [Ancylomarina longa]|uniref:DUF493 family protein n=1 Tax=Ancylomarina longa TaxID=2487017 RepID=A0A434AYN9_9BACT|nr:DUF493 family protein [Ancylomarina longa]RUT79691.1 DUF493 family protein [Ancylomarina longa]
MDQEKYKQMRQQLLDSNNWPSLYMFKFIIPNKEDKLTAIKNLFPENTEFVFKTSRDIRFIGITVKIIMDSPDTVLKIYDQAKNIEGIISL